MNELFFGLLTEAARLLGRFFYEGILRRSKDQSNDAWDTVTGGFLLITGFFALVFFVI